MLLHLCFSPDACFEANFSAFWPYINILVAYISQHIPVISSQLFLLDLFLEHIHRIFIVMADSSVHDVEKRPESVRTSPTDPGCPKENEIDIQIRRTSDIGSAKLAKDGFTILIPQPSDDPDDPLNWSWTKKHVRVYAAIRYLPADRWSGRPCNHGSFFSPHRFRHDIWFGPFRRSGS